MKIIWAITGAGHLLRECMDILEELSHTNEITLVMSKASEEVIELYGLNNKIKEILHNNKNSTQIFEDDEKYSYPFSGKITHEKYDFVILAPATANTVAKIVHGIADNLVTNIVAQSGKGQIPAVVLPVDQKEGLTQTILPPYIDKNECRMCKECTVKSTCPQGAVDPPNIDSKKCTNCLKCENKCPYNAIKTDKKIGLYIRKIDADNTRKLEKIENINTVITPQEIVEKIGKKS